MTATALSPAEPNPFAELPLSKAHQELRLFMAAQFQQEFTECVGTVPVTAVDEHGTILGSYRPPIEKATEPISDFDLASIIFHQLEQVPATKGKTAAFAFIRFDVTPPEIVVFDLAEHLVEVLRPPLGADGPGWTGQLSSHPDQTPRGGSVGPVAPASSITSAVEAEDLAEVSDAALEEVGAAMLEKTARFAAEVDNASELEDAVLYDGEPYWIYCRTTFPDSPGTLKSAVRAAAEIARKLPSAASALRFRHKNKIYILALFSHEQLEVGRLIKTKFVRPGQLAEAKTFDAAQYLQAD